MEIKLPSDYSLDGCGSHNAELPIEEQVEIIVNKYKFRPNTKTLREQLTYELSALFNSVMPRTKVNINVSGEGKELSVEIYDDKHNNYF